MFIKYVKVYVAQKVVVEVVVVVINNKFGFLICWFGLLCCLLILMVWFVVLLEDCVDLMYYSYDGGGVIIDGFVVLVCKSVCKDVFLLAQYYVDQIFGVFIDVESMVSVYSEECI